MKKSQWTSGDCVEQSASREGASRKVLKLLNEFYSYGKQNNEKVDEQIHHKQQIIAWNKSYLDCLAKGEVTFDEPVWTGNDIKSDIIDDFYFLAKSIPSLTKEEREKLYYSADLSFTYLQTLLKKNGYSEPKDISRS